MVNNEPIQHLSIGIGLWTPVCGPDDSTDVYIWNSGSKEHCIWTIVSLWTQHVSRLFGLRALYLVCLTPESWTCWSIGTCWSMNLCVWTSWSVEPGMNLDQPVGLSTLLS